MHSWNPGINQATRDTSRSTRKCPARYRPLRVATPDDTRPDWPNFYRDPAKAASYEERRTRSWWRRLSWRRELALARALVTTCGAKGRWLDLACGPGRTLSAVPGNAVGVDLSLAMLALGRERARATGARFVAADATRLPFADASFEGVLCLRFLHHLTSEARRAVLGEMRRVGGRWIVVSFPNIRTLRAWSRRLRGKPLGPRRALEDMARELAESGWIVRRSAAIIPFLAETTLVLAERGALDR
jgi:SAM-dependent methyltransferase